MVTLSPTRSKQVALIVEDDPTLLDLVTETVESLGHEVRSATSQEDATATASVTLTTTAEVTEYKLFLPIIHSP